MLSDRLLLIISESGKNQKDFADTIGVKPAYITDVVKGRSGFSQAILLKIREKYDINVDWLLTGQGSMRIAVKASMQNDSAAQNFTDPELKKAIDNLIKVAQKKDSSKQQAYLHSDLRELPELGRIAAGHLTEETAKQGKVLLFPRAIIPDKGPLFALRVRGDSMKDANIHDGDYAILKPVSNPAELKPGAIVAALVDNENTLKRLYREDGGAILRAANAAFDDIHVRNFQELVIQGHLKYLIKKWHDE